MGTLFSALRPKKKKLFGCPPHLPPAGERVGGRIFLNLYSFFLNVLLLNYIITIQMVPNEILYCYFTYRPLR